jgi:predicted SprT family Zn-dependent metalloprotease
MEARGTSCNLGLCWFREKRIQLSARFVAHNPLHDVRRTVLHEIAHALTGHGHDDVWRAKCRELGIEPKTSNFARMGSGWEGECPACGQMYFRVCRPKKGLQYNCRCEVKGQVMFKPVRCTP